MKKTLLPILVGIISSTINGQVGINTTTPTKMLDVNGDMRIRTLNNITNPNVAYVVTTDSDGNLSKTTPFDMMYSSGIYVSSTSPNQWNNIRMGSKGTRLDFTGRANIGSGIDFAFSVFYDYGTGFANISAPVVENNATISLTGTTSNSFTVAITNAGTTRNFIFTISTPNSFSLANITVTNTASIGVNGSFLSLYHS